MNVSLSITITLVSVAWSAGMFVGLFAAKFVQKKECKVHRTEIETDSSIKFDAIWKRIDAIQDVLTGGKYAFEIRLKQQGQ